MASVLCVDDEPIVLSLLRDLLAPLGHDTIHASSVDEAIQALSRQHVDLILLDCVMPGQDGFAFLTYLGEHAVRIPTIMMTGYSTVEHAVASIRGGAAEYITKPLRAESVRLVVASVLQSRRGNGRMVHAPGEPNASLVPPTPQAASSSLPIAAEKAASGEVLNLRELQQIAIRQALEKTKGHRIRAAELLGINERTLRNKLKLDDRQ